MADQTGPVVVVGVDGSDLSLSALRWADEYAHALGARLRVVTAWHWMTSYAVPMAFDGYDPAADAQAVADAAQRAVTHCAERVEVVVCEGPSGPALVTASEAARALVVGSRGHNPISTILLGSTSAYCVHHAGCPVVVVR